MTFTFNPTMWIEKERKRELWTDMLDMSLLFVELGHVRRRRDNGEGRRSIHLLA